MKKYILALDEGTTSARAILFDRDSNIVSMAQHEFAQIYPAPGWVEQDPMAIYANQYAALTECIAKSGISAEEIAEEIRKTDELIVKYTGTKPWMFRPPYIDHNETMHQTIEHTFICGVGCDDWVPECTAQQRYDVMKAQAKDGVMFLLHDLVGNDNTVEALKMIIPELKAQGYTFVTATQLFEKKGIKPEPKNGKIYSNVMD
mgnify:CR=1 FL=1